MSNMAFFKVLSLTSGAVRIPSGQFSFTKGFSSSKNIIFTDWNSCISQEESTITLTIGNRKLDVIGHSNSVCASAEKVYIACKKSLIIVNKRTGSIDNIPCSGIVILACSGSYTYCIKDDHSMHTIGVELNAPVFSPILFTEPIKVKSVACGSGFVLCLTNLGEVYSQGFGSRGQLGLGDLDDRSSFMKIDALEILSVISIAAGNWHSICLTDSGDVYAWGWNEFGQLGCPSYALHKDSELNFGVTNADLISVLALPRPVDIPNDEVIEMISCGARHTACLSQHGELFVFGWNGFGQLGFDPKITPALDVPTRVDLLDHGKDYTIADIKCGLWSTTLTLTNENCETKS